MLKCRVQPPSLLGLAPLFGLVGVLLVAGTALADLERDVRRALSTSGLGGATVSVSVRDPETGEELVEIDDDRPMIPASNMKLFTSGAALHRFGTEFKARTTFQFDGETLWVIEAATRRRIPDPRGDLLDPRGPGARTPGP